jgi:hypothetical protein
MHDEIKNRLNLRRSCCHWVQILYYSYRSLSKQMKIKVRRTIILPLLDGCETWSVTLREECWLGVFKVYGAEENTFGPKI